MAHLVAWRALTSSPKASAKLAEMACHLRVRGIARLGASSRLNNNKYKKWRENWRQPAVFSALVAAHRKYHLSKPVVMLPSGR